MKKFTINKDGEVVAASKFGYDEIVITAKNKTEAQKEFLKRCLKAAKCSPVVVSNAGKRCNITLGLGWYNINEGQFVGEYGNRFQNGAFLPLCIGGIQGNDIKNELLQDSSFQYYSSKEFLVRGL